MLAAAGGAVGGGAVAAAAAVAVAGAAFAAAAAGATSFLPTVALSPINNFIARQRIDCVMSCLPGSNFKHKSGGSNTNFFHKLILLIW